MIELTVNGESRQVPAGTTLAGLAASLDLAGKRYAIELNGGIVPRSAHAGTPLNLHDRVEIVVAVGGG